MEQSKKSYIGWIILAVLFLGSVVALGVFLFIRKKKQEETNENRSEPNLDNEVEPGTADERYLNNFKLIYTVLKDAQVPDADTRSRFYAAQAAHESAIWTSPLFQRTNNMFGMNHPKVRSTTSIGSSGVYASYNTPEDSVKDRLLWDEYNKIEYPADIVGFNKKLQEFHYYEDVPLKYLNGLKSHLAKINRLITQG